MDATVWIELLGINSKSEKILLRISIKTILLIIHLILTFWIAQEIGYPIPVSILSFEGLKNSIANFTLIVPILIFLFIYNGKTLAILIIGFFFAWAMMGISLVPFSRYGRKVFKKKFIDKEKTYLSQNIDHLEKEIVNLETQDSETILLNWYLARTIAAVLIAYVFIVRNEFPKIYFVSIAIFIFLLGILFSLSYTLQFFTRIHRERKIRYIKRRLNEII